MTLDTQGSYITHGNKNIFNSNGNKCTGLDTYVIHDNKNNFNLLHGNNNHIFT